MPFVTTLETIRPHYPCESCWKKLLRHLGKTKEDDEPLPLLTVLDSNGLYDTMRYLWLVEGHDADLRLFEVWCARRVQHLLTDPHSLQALKVAEDFAYGRCTNDELRAASSTAWIVAFADVTTGASWATASATDVDARFAVRDAARFAVRAAVRAAGEDARESEEAAQAARLRQLFIDGKWIGSTQPQLDTVEGAPI